ELEKNPGLLVGEQTHKTIDVKDYKVGQEANAQLSKTLKSPTASSSESMKIGAERRIGAEIVKVVSFNPDLVKKILTELGSKSLEEQLSTSEGRGKIQALLANGEVRVEIDGVN
ncbi:MAG: hypothetical protein WC513_09470, partial [Bacteroidales bacterium]